MRRNTLYGNRIRSCLVLAGWLAITVPALLAQEISKSGVVVEVKSEGAFLLRDFGGREIEVLFDERTEISERKKNPFRRADRYSSEQLVRGLQVDVRGYLKDEQRLLAAEIKFTQDDLRTAEIVSASVVPIEKGVADAQYRVSELEQRQREDSQEVSGQLTELSEAYKTTRDEGRETREASERAQNTADVALSNSNLATQRLNTLDDYEVGRTETIYYKFDGVDLSEEAQAKLDALVQDMPSQKGFLIEVRGFTSADGDPVYNSRLSKKRAEAVVQYLIEHHHIDLRRFIAPYGFGEQHPIADNAIPEGRSMNRRVEVRVLVSRGLGNTAELKGFSEENVELH